MRRPAGSEPKNRIKRSWVVNGLIVSAAFLVMQSNAQSASQTATILKTLGPRSDTFSIGFLQMNGASMKATSPTANLLISMIQHGRSSKAPEGYRKMRFGCVERLRSRKT